MKIQQLLPCDQTFIHSSAYQKYNAANVRGGKTVTEDIIGKGVGWDKTMKSETRALYYYYWWQAF